MEVVFTFRLRVLLLIICTTNNVLSDDLVMENEVEYQEPLTDGHGLIYSKQTGFSGDSLIIGTRIINGERRLLGQENPLQYKCIKKDNLNHYNFSAISIGNRSSESFEVKDGEPIQPMRASDYFLHINREVWDCQDNVETSRGMSFVRIVNELISIREIREIKYCEGVEVASVNYDGNGWRTKIKEIRYMAKYEDDGPYETLRYHGKLILQGHDPAQRIFNMLGLQPIEPYLEKYDIDHKELKFRKDGENKVAVDTEGKTLKIGASWTKNRTHYITGYTCEKALGMHPLPRRFLTKVYHQIIVDEQNPDSKIYGRIPEPQLSHFFTLAKSTVWHCTSQNQENEGLEFYRVVNEMIGTERIREVVYEDSVVGLSVINQTDFGENIKSVRFTDIGLFYTHSGERLTKEVNYTLVHREHTKSFFENNIELKHTLTPTSVYRTLINPKGYDIRVGSKVTSTIGSPNDRSKCEKFSVSERATFNTIFKIKIGDGGVWHFTEIVKGRTNEYFKYVKQVSWRCTESRHRYEFYRIINKLEVSIPLRFIETFDGIQIVQKPKDDKVFLEITELKYILTTGAKDTIMYVGKLEFTYSNDRSSHALDLNAVKMSEEETTHYLGVAEYTHFPLKDFQILSNENQTLKIAEKPNRLKFPVQQNNIGKAGDVVECTMVRDCASQFFPGFEAENGTGVVLKKLEKFDDVPTYLSYFKSDFFDLWLCEQQHQRHENTGRATTSRRRKGYRFYRVVTRQSLKKGLKIGEIEYGKRDKVWIEMKNVSMNQYDVLMKQIRYLNATNPSYKTVNYDGYVVFEETRTSRLWKSGTKYMETLDLRKKKKSELRYIPYLLDRKKFGIYKIRGTNNGQPRNESLLIGSQWQAVLEVGSEIYECTKKDTFLENLRSQEKYLTNIKRTEQTGLTDSVLDYFDFKQITIWTCKHEDKEFTRVVNHFTTATDFNRVKQVQYYDGVTILKNITNRRDDDPLEIIEVKYLDESRNRVLKFLGELKFVDASDTDIKPISFTTLTDVYKKSTEFDFLSPKEVYKTYVIGNKGSIVEVGQYYENELGASSIMCEYTTLTKEESQKLELEPKVAIVEESEESKDLLERKVIKNTDLKNYFNIEKQFWNCTYGRSEYIRVHNKLTWTRKKSLHAIHHFDGVTVDVDGKSVEIEEIKYVRRDDSVEHKFGGFVKFKESATGTNQKTEDGIRDFRYIHDTEVVNFKSASNTPTGLVLEIGHKLHLAIQVDDDVTPECRQEQGHVYRESWRTTIKRLKLSTEKNNDLVWNYVSPKVIFDNVEQELWSCKKGQETVFYRVVERMSLSKQPISMYYHDGVSIQTSTFYDRTVVQQITEVKFLKNKEDVLFKKYAGRLILLSEADVVVDKLFPQTNRDERRMNWPLNSLMHYALLKYKEADDTRKFRMVNVTDVEVREKRQFQTTIVGSGIRVVQIGTFWEEKIESNTGVMRCTLDDITYVYGLRYMPKVVELIDKKAYLLSDDDFLELFKVKNMKVWLCTNKVDKIIRVVSQLEGKVPFFAIRHTDAVTLEIDAITHSVNANETIYINALNSKVVKYDEAFSLLEKVPDSENQEKKTTVGRIRSYLSKAFSCTGAGCQVAD